MEVGRKFMHSCMNVCEYACMYIYYYYGISKCMHGCMCVCFHSLHFATAIMYTHTHLCCYPKIVVVLWIEKKHWITLFTLFSTNFPTINNFIKFNNFSEEHHFSLWKYCCPEYLSPLVCSSIFIFFFWTCERAQILSTFNKVAVFFFFFFVIVVVYALVSMLVRLFVHIRW